MECWQAKLKRLPKRVSMNKCVNLNMKRHDDAMTHATKALSLAPDSEDVKDTVKQIKDAIEKRRR